MTKIIRRAQWGRNAPFDFMIRTRFTIAVLFFLSGMAGLIYEVVWAKHLTLFLGSTAQAHTIVLATFMGGLALGYYLFGKIGDRAQRALNLYGWMEIAIGLCGALFIPLLPSLGSAYIALVGYFGLDSIYVAPAQFFLGALLLVVPTVLMGGTLPVLSRFVVRSLGEVEIQVGWLYFLNSLGAVCGSLLAGLLLIPWVGLNLSIMAAAALNLSVGLIAVALRQWEKRAREKAPPQAVADFEGEELYSLWQIRIVIFGIALSGGAALIYEIAWIRLLSLVLGSSTYSFSLMLSAFIAGIALGSFVVAQKWIRKFEPFLLFAVAELGVALSIILTLPLYERLPFYFAILANLWVRLPETFWLYQLTNFFICFLLMLFPTFFLGMTLPLVSQVAAHSLKRLAENIGKIFAANTAGTLLGAVAAGLVLLPFLGIKRLIEVGVLINLAVGAFALWMGPYLTWQKKTLTLGASFGLFVFYLSFFPAWDRNILSSGVFRLRGAFPGWAYEEFKRASRDKVLYYKDGVNMTVAVVQGKDHQIVLKVNGKPDASSRADLPTQILLAQIPLLLKPDAKKVATIGLGSGITAGSVLRHPIERLDLVEISPEVVEASRFFAPHNHDVLKSPRLKLYLEDGKTFLKVTPERYDIVISEPSNPWIAGIGNLFSVEFYQDVKERLQPDGLMAQWFHIYEMTDETLRVVLRTFTESFEHVTLWNCTGSDLLLIGSRAPFSVDFKKSLDRFNHTAIKDELKRLGIESFPTILSLQMTSDEGVRKAAGKGRVNEDLFPILEYEAPKALFLNQSSQFLNSHDERIHPRERFSLYFSQYLEKNRLSIKESKDMTHYHLLHGGPTRLSLARAFLDVWLQQGPRDPEAHWALARIEEETGNREAALRELRFVLSLSPNHPEYLEAAARLEFQVYLNQRSLLKRLSPQKPLAHLHRLLSLDGSRKDQIYRKIARVHAADRNYRASVDYLEKAVSYTQTHPGGELQPDALWLEAANLAIEMDDLKAALAYLEKALAYDPGNLAVKKSLAQLSRLKGRGQ